MSEIRSNNWNDFAQQVAIATKAGNNVQVLTGPENGKDFVARVIDDTPETTELEVPTE